MRKHWRWLPPLIAALAVSLAVGATAVAGGMTGPDTSTPAAPDAPAKTPVSVSGVTAQRLTASQMLVKWTETPEAESYMIMRRDTNADGWACVGRARAGETEFTDDLGSIRPRQFIYRVDPVPADRTRYESVPGDTALATNLVICLDPGHFRGSSGACTDDGKTYRECDFVLDVGLRLRDILRDKYGIECRMTRENEKIEVFGRVNYDSNVELRGLYSEGCNIFISLHTNANAHGVHGYDTWYQPVYINKPMVILNTMACDDELMVDMANRLGVALAEKNYELGIAANDTFATMRAGAVPAWGAWHDDDPSSAGLVCWRKGNRGDYYGVLRGSNSVGVPGMIIEHAYHTVLGMRKLANDGILAPIYAEIDADCIARACGFTPLSELE